MSKEPEQKATVEFFRSGIPFGGERPDYIETHISHLFLGKDKVYKLKRAVTLPFLTFETLEDRRVGCERELAINTQFAPEIYLQVLPVTKSGETVELGGKGEVTDYVVEMRRFDQDGLFRDRLRAGNISREQVLELADCISASHLTARLSSEFGGAKYSGQTHENITSTMEQFSGDVFEPEMLRAWRDQSTGLHQTISPLLEARRRHGRVRDVHGDLHLGNVCFWHDAPTPFDAIEFRDDYSTIDVLYDTAFTVMDFLKEGRQDFAGQFLSRYLGATRDYSGLKALPFFMGLRAAVRAMVHALESKDVEGDARAAEEDTARAYLTLAMELIGLRDPYALAIGGFSGTGKSTVAGDIAGRSMPAPGPIILQTDAIRKRLFGENPETRLPKTAYASAVSDQVYSILRKDAGRTLRSNWPVILDATFTLPTSRDQVEDCAKRASVPFKGLWLEAKRRDLEKRVRLRATEITTSDADVGVLNHQLDEGVGDITWHHMESVGGREVMADKVLEWLEASSSFPRRRESSLRLPGSPPSRG